MKKITYKLNTGGNCMLYFRFVSFLERTVIKVWDNFTDYGTRFVEVDPVNESFVLGHTDDPSTFYLNEFTPAN